MPSERMRYLRPRFRPRTDIPLTGCLKEMDSCFMIPKNEDDLITIVENLDPWETMALKNLKQGKVPEALEISLGILEEIGYRFEADEYFCCFDDVCDTDECCKRSAYIITQVMQSPKTDVSIKETVMRQLRQIARHSSFDDYGYFDMEQFIKDGGVMNFQEWWRY